jgi:hypothetical protein
MNINLFLKTIELPADSESMFFAGQRIFKRMPSQPSTSGKNGVLELYFSSADKRN